MISNLFLFSLFFTPKLSIPTVPIKRHAPLLVKRFLGEIQNLIRWGSSMKAGPTFTRGSFQPKLLYDIFRKEKIFSPRQTPILSMNSNPFVIYRNLDTCDSTLAIHIHYIPNRKPIKNIWLQDRLSFFSSVGIKQWKWLELPLIMVHPHMVVKARENMWV